MPAFIYGKSVSCLKNYVFFVDDRVVEQLGGKQLVMTHLSHEDPNVRYEALLAVQKLMVHNWYVVLLI